MASGVASCLHKVRVCTSFFHTLGQTMDLQLNPDAFDKQQAVLVDELVKTIQVKLVEAGLGKSDIKDLTASLAFSITCVIDGIADIESGGEQVRPYLTFQVNDELVHCGENSFMHELIYDALGRLVSD